MFHILPKHCRVSLGTIGDQTFNACMQKYGEMAIAYFLVAQLDCKTTQLH
jgi:hypothetical protein